MVVSSPDPTDPQDWCSFYAKDARESEERWRPVWKPSPPPPSFLIEIMSDPKVKSFLNYSFDVFTLLLLIADVVTDVLILQEFWEDGETAYFALSLTILLIAQLGYTLLLISQFDSFSPNESVKTFLVVVVIFPFGLFVPFFLMLYQYSWTPLVNFLRWIDIVENRSVRINDDNNNEYGDLREWIGSKLKCHGGFLVESFVESIPQAVLQTVYMVSHNRTTPLNVFSVVTSMVSVASKGFLFSYSIDSPTFIFNLSTFVFDVFGVFASVAFIFYVSPNETQWALPFVDDVTLSPLGTIWVWKELILIAALVILGLFCLVVGIVQVFVVYWTADHEKAIKYFIGVILAAIVVVIALGPALVLLEGIKFTLFPLLLSGVADTDMRNYPRPWMNLSRFVMGKSEFSANLEKMMRTRGKEMDEYEQRIMEERKAMAIEQQIDKQQSADSLRRHETREAILSLLNSNSLLQGIIDYENGHFSLPTHLSHMEDKEFLIFEKKFAALMSKNVLCGLVHWALLQAESGALNEIMWHRYNTTPWSSRWGSGEAPRVGQRFISYREMRDYYEKVDNKEICPVRELARNASLKLNGVEVKCEEKEESNGIVNGSSVDSNDSSPFDVGSPFTPTFLSDASLFDSSSPLSDLYDVDTDMMEMLLNSLLDSSSSFSSLKESKIRLFIVNCAFAYFFLRTHKSYSESDYNRKKFTKAREILRTPANLYDVNSEVMETLKAGWKFVRTQIKEEVKATLRNRQLRGQELAWHEWGWAMAAWYFLLVVMPIYIITSLYSIFFPVMAFVYNIIVDGSSLVNGNGSLAFVLSCVYFFFLCVLLLLFPHMLSFRLAITRLNTFDTFLGGRTVSIIDMIENLYYNFCLRRWARLVLSGQGSGRRTEKGEEAESVCLSILGDDDVDVVLPSPLVDLIVSYLPLYDEVEERRAMGLPLKDIFSGVPFLHQSRTSYISMYEGYFFRLEASITGMSSGTGPAHGNHSMMANPRWPEAMNEFIIARTKAMQAFVNEFDLREYYRVVRTTHSERELIELEGKANEYLKKREKKEDGNEDVDVAPPSLGVPTIHFPSYRIVLNPKVKERFFKHFDHLVTEEGFNVVSGGLKDVRKDEEKEVKDVNKDEII